MKLQLMPLSVEGRKSLSVLGAVLTDQEVAAMRETESMSHLDLQVVTFATQGQSAAARKRLAPKLYKFLAEVCEEIDEVVGSDYI